MLQLCQENLNQMRDVFIGKYTDKSTEEGSKYIYRIITNNTSGDSEPSESSNQITTKCKQSY